MPQLILTFLGPPLIKSDDRYIEPESRKAVALLAYLAVTGKAQRRDSLAVLLWPDYGQTQGRMPRSEPRVELRLYRSRTSSPPADSAP